MIGIILILLSCYLLGSIPFSLFVAKIKGINLTKVGSGNVGATNVYRTAGLFYGVIAFFLDSGKGFCAAWLASLVSGGNSWITVLGAAFAIIGHTFSPFVGFKGGKGVATGVGVLFFLQPLVAVIGLLLELIIIKITGYVSLASILSAITILVLMLFPFFNVEVAYSMFVLIVVVYIIYKHKANIKRLINGQENRV